jgi:enoyl-CoA hydratase/carnithine racemase
MKVLFEKKGPLAFVTINRPERLNACDGETYRRLTEVWGEFRDDPELRVGILTGAGDRAFCVGTDVKAADFHRLAEEPHNLPFSLLSTLAKPLIAAINGHANGSGLEQALCCDLRVAAEHAQFGLGDARLGWLPAAGGTQRLPRLIPVGRALELLYTGNRIDAREALRLGLVEHVVPLGHLLSKCEEIAMEICKSAPLAVQSIKPAVLRGLELPLAEGLKLEQELYQRLQGTADAREGAQAFAEKRPPQWRGK